jgi:Mrp family chromosome partitioning ATPase/capsular polysaccharide biosynthesis protein
MKATTIEHDRFEPTVFGAVRRYRIMVGVIALLMAAGGVGYSLIQTEVFKATATITVPQSTLAQDKAGDQYFDSQVLLLQSHQVAERAAMLANESLHEDVLSLSDFAGQARSLVITPPEQSAPGSFGSSIVTVSFSWPDAKVAQVGVNATLQAFDQIRASQIAAQGVADVMAIEKAIRDARTKGQRSDLEKQRAQTLVNLQLDLASHPTIGWASEPQLPINGNSKRSGAIGLVAGLVLGAAIAYARASRHQRLDDRLDPVAIYDAPLMGDIPPPGRNRMLTGPKSPLPMAVDPLSPAAEAFRFMAGSVQRIRATRDHQLVVAFVSADQGFHRSTVVANLALAIAESGTPVLAVDADTNESTLTELLLPGTPPGDGFAQVVAGKRPVSDCVEPSPLNADVTVLRAGTTQPKRTTGMAYAEAVDKVIAEAKACFDLVLIDSPPLLSVANAVELVNDSDAAIVVLGPGESVQDHVTMLERLDQVESGVAGYVYRREARGPRFVRRLREQSALRRLPPPYLPSTPVFRLQPDKARRR